MKIDGALVSTDWLADNLEQTNLRIYDTSIFLEYLEPKDGVGGYQANSGRDNLTTMALVDAAYRSAAERRAVDLSEILTGST